MRSDRLKTVGSLVIIAGSLLVLFFSLRESPPKLDPRPHEALGQVMAEEAAKLASGGGRITLIARDTSAIKNPVSDFQVKGFMAGLRKANLTLSATNLIKQDPLRLMRVPPAEFAQILKKKSEGDVVVSLLGPPILESDQRSKLPEKGPRIVAVCSGAMPAQVNLKELFQQNLLHAAIISRAHPGTIPRESGNLREWFDCFYQVITATNQSELTSVTNNPLK